VYGLGGFFLWWGFVFLVIFCFVCGVRMGVVVNGVMVFLFCFFGGFVCLVCYCEVW